MRSSTYTVRPSSIVEIARGSALECGAIQDLLHVCEALSADDNNQQKALLDLNVFLHRYLGD